MNISKNVIFLIILALSILALTVLFSQNFLRSSAPTSHSEVPSTESSTGTIATQRYAIGQTIDVTGTVGEILSDFGSFAGMTEEEIQAKNDGVLPRAEMKIALDKEYILMAGEEEEWPVEGVRMSIDACVDDVKSGDHVRVRGVIRSIPWQIGLVLGCEDASTSVKKI